MLSKTDLNSEVLQCIKIDNLQYEMHVILLMSNPCHSLFFKLLQNQFPLKQLKQTLSKKKEPISTQKKTF